MRVLLLLVLTFFVGCNANSSHAGQSPSELDMLIWKLQDIFGANIQAVGRSLNDIMTKTEPGIFWSAKIRECSKQAEQYVDSAWELVPPETKDQISEVARRTFSNIRHVEHQMKNVKREIEPIFEKAVPVADMIVVELTDKVEQVKYTASQYIASLKPHVQECLEILKSYVTH